MKVQDKNFVVTGGGNGIGREVVLGLLRKGARVDAIDLRSAGLEETARLAGDHADALHGWELDVTDQAAVEKTAAEIIGSRGHLDGVVNVAGIIQRFAPFSELSVPEMEKVMAVNFWGRSTWSRRSCPSWRAGPRPAWSTSPAWADWHRCPGRRSTGRARRR